MALYHTYRPQTFADIIGQAHITTTLENQVKKNKTAHAYLFSGPRGVGKTTTARILAKSLNCPNRKDGNFEPCNACSSCDEISASRSIDVIEIDAASHTGVDNVRQNIIENAQFKPTKSTYKIFIIDEVHMLSTAAFNALLKTLEEPPTFVTFILATTDPHKLPLTIISRCQRFNFGKVADDEMKKYLKTIAKKEDTKIDDEVIDRIVRKGEGCARDALSLLDQIMATGENHITTDTASLVLPGTHIEMQMEYVEYLLTKKLEPALSFVHKLVQDGVNIPHFATELIEFERVLMIATVDLHLAEHELDLTKEAKKQLSEMTKLTSQIDMVHLLDLTMKRANEIKSSPLPQLPLEMLTIEWCANTSQSHTPLQNHVADTKPNVPETNIHEVTKTTLKEKVKQIVSKNTITKADVETKWQVCMNIVEKETPSLAFVLKMAHLDEVDANTIKFSVPYTFHQEKLMDKQIKNRLETIFTDALETKMKIDVIVQEQAEQDRQNQELENLASALGGEVIN